MECPQCAFANPDIAKFCGQCGKKLEQICSECNSPNPSQFKFCSECGSDLIARKAALKELSFDEKLDKTQRYLPRGITDKIISPTCIPALFAAPFSLRPLIYTPTTLSKPFSLAMSAVTSWMVTPRMAL